MRRLCPAIPRRTMMIAALALAGGGVRAGAASPAAVCPMEMLVVDKGDGQPPLTLKYQESILEAKHGGPPHVCACRAVLLRVLQLVAARRDEQRLQIAELRLVRSGWPTEANCEVLVETLGLPRGKLKLSSDAPPCDQSVAPGAWWQFTFNDGRTITVWATKTALPDDFVELHVRHKREKSDETRQAIMPAKEALVKVHAATPLGDLFVVAVE